MFKKAEDHKTVKPNKLIKQWKKQVVFCWSEIGIGRIKPIKLEEVRKEKNNKQYKFIFDHELQI